MPARQSIQAPSMRQFSGKTQFLISSAKRACGYCTTPAETQKKGRSQEGDSHKRPENARNA